MGLSVLIEEVKQPQDYILLCLKTCTLTASVHAPVRTYLKHTHNDIDQSF